MLARDLRNSMYRLALYSISLLVVLAMSFYFLNASSVRAQEPDPNGKGGIAEPAAHAEFGIEPLDDAIASGKLDVSVAQQIVDEGSAEAIVVFDGQQISNAGQELRKAKSLLYNDSEILGVISGIVAEYQESAAASAGSEVTVLTNYRNIPSQHVVFESLDGLMAYIANDEVTGIRENRIFDTFLSESLPLINQPTVAGNGWTGGGTAVAVLDTGVDYTHADFGSCSAPGDQGCKVLFLADTGVTDDGSPDDDGHGTNVSGIVVGVAPDTGLVVHDVFEPGGGAPTAAIDLALDTVLTQKDTYNIVSVNMSLGGGGFANHCPTDALAAPIIALRDAGVSVVIATGNDAGAFIASPACVPGAVSVGATYDANVGGVGYSNCQDATTAADQITCFSNTRYFLSVLAPGALITAGGLSNFAGTSMAAPHVAGEVAVLREHSPAASVIEIEEAIIACGPTITDTRGGANNLRTHRIDLSAAINHLDGSTCAPGPGPDNDHINAATLVTLNSDIDFSESVDVTDATNEPADPVIDCTPVPHGKTIWYEITPNSDATLDVVTTAGSDYDTILNLWTGTPGDLTNVACNDDDPSGGLTSILTNVPLSEVNTYYLEVAGFAGISGNLELLIQSTINSVGTPFECNYDEDASGSIDFGEAIEAVADYLLSRINSELGRSPTREETEEVVTAFFLGEAFVCP